ncbi:MAG: HupE/UreJ family protein [Candidatus Binatia bacterium]
MKRAAFLRPALAAALAASLLVLLTPGGSLAHGLAPALLSLRETGAGLFEVTWKSSTLRLPGTNVQPALPAHCRQTSSATAADDNERVTLRWTIDCGPSGLTGQSIGVDDLATAKIDALLRIERPDGTTIQTVLSARAPSFTVPAQPSRWDVVHGYAALGIEHILTGPDHLLFVFGLLLLVSASRLLLQTITAFTLGHSITLSMAALHLAQVPSRPVEVLIALSVLTLAVELARDAGRGTLLRRFPWAMALAFGLLHGFGFAGALAEAGLPPGDIPLALVSFNGGIEIGQLVFVGAVLAAGAVFTRWVPSAAARCVRPAVYAMGILAAFWCFERLAVWLG